jgi:oxazoline/thiazoline synthase
MSKEREMTSAVREIVSRQDTSGIWFAIGEIVHPTRSRSVAASAHGRTEEEACARVGFEAVERVCACFHGDEDLLLGSPGALATVVEGLDEDVELPLPEGEWEWVKAISLRTGREVLVPAGIAFIDYVPRSGPKWFRADSAGCAAGATTEQAVLHGLLEVVERDALALWWRLGVNRDVVEVPESLRPIRESLEKRGRTLTLFGLQTDLGIPVIAAVSARDGRRIYVGSAAGVSEAEASEKAVLELLQFVFWDEELGIARSRTQWLEEGTLEHFDWLDGRGAGSRSTAPAPEAGRPMAWVRDQVLAAGFDPLIVDLSREPFEIPVVRAIVPGLCRPNTRRASKRMVELPSRLGWQVGEGNPYPVPL